MASVSAEASGYRLVYAQPNPEVGERICVGLLFEEGKRARLWFDETFSKVRCVAPNSDFEVLRYLFHCLQDELRLTTTHEEVLHRFSPQVKVSQSYHIASNATDAFRLALFHRFAGQEKRETGPAEHAPSQVGKRILEFVKTLETGRVDVLESASPKALFGRSYKGLKPVAVGIRGARGLMLIDGVSLHDDTPARVVRQAQSVQHNFWLYRRVEPDLFQEGRRLTTVGVVVNGLAVKKKKVQEAHDFAIDVFRSEADLSIDASSSEDAERLEDAVRLLA